MLVSVLYGFLGLELPIPENLPDGNYDMTLSYYVPGYMGSEPLKEIGKVSPSTPNETQSDDVEYYIPKTGWLDVLFPYGMTTVYSAIVKDGTVMFRETDTRPSRVDNETLESEYPEYLLKYYNLQGMEIKSPIPGEVTIVRKGKKVYKAVF